MDSKPLASQGGVTDPRTLPADVREKLLKARDAAYKGDNAGSASTRYTPLLTRSSAASIRGLASRIASVSSRTARNMAKRWSKPMTDQSSGTSNLRLKTELRGRQIHDLSVECGGDGDGLGSDGFMRPDPLCTAAADEIERLRAALAMINMLACYASEEDTDSRAAVLLQIGKLARGEVSPEVPESPAET